MSGKKSLDTPELRRQILEFVSGSGPDRWAICAATGLSYHQLNNLIDRPLRKEYAAAVEAYRAREEAQRQIAPRGAARQRLDIPVRPFEVHFVAPQLPEPADGETALEYGDSHYPYQDKRAIGCVMAVAADAKPRRIVHKGDGIDCWQISRFRKNPLHRDWLQDNIDQFREHLGQMRTLLPDSEMTLLEGNHEARFTEMLWGLEGAAREIPRLRKVQEATSWPELLELEGIGWKWVGEREQSHAKILPKVITKHGNVIRKWSGWTAKAEWEKYGRAGTSGHTHRLGCFFHRDHNGMIQWWESGCTCSLDPEYGTDFDWHQGFLVMTWSKDLALWGVEPVSIRDGRCLWRGRVYRG